MTSPVDVPETPAAELAPEIERGVPVVDVRRPEEWTGGRIGEAMLIPMGEISDHVGELEARAGGGPLYVICRSGVRSLQVAGFLRTQGIDARNVAGGMLAWTAAGHEVETGPTR